MDFPVFKSILVVCLLFTGELRPLMLRDTNKQCLWTPIICWYGVYVFLLFRFADLGLVFGFHHGIYYFLHLWWLKVLLGIIVEAGIWSLLESVEHLFRPLRVSTKKSGIILNRCACDTWSFPLATFNILSLFCWFSALIIMWNFFSGPVYLVLCMLLILS